MPVSTGSHVSASLCVYVCCLCERFVFVFALNECFVLVPSSSSGTPGRGRCTLGKSHLMDSQASQELQNHFPLLIIEAILFLFGDENKDMPRIYLLNICL